LTKIYTICKDCPNTPLSTNFHHRNPRRRWDKRKEPKKGVHFMRYQNCWFVAAMLVVGLLASTTSPALAFIFTTIGDGDITVFDAPNASFTQAFSINAGGDVTGYFSDVSQSYKGRGFVRARNSDITVFDAPNALAT